MEKIRSATLASAEPFAQPDARVGTQRWSRVAACAAVGVITLLSRLPFLSAGYGLDPDALRVVSAARTIRATSEYVYSRAPGYPLQEVVVALLVPGGEWVVNGMTAVWSAIAVAAFAWCLAELLVPGAFMLALALGAVPVIYVNSTCAMDYVWALAFLLIAACFVLRKQSWLAGIFVGLAIGTRVTSGAMLLPLGLLCFARAASRDALRAWVRMTSAALIVGAGCFAPVYARYGTKFFTYSEGVGGGSTEAIVKRATLGVWGPVGCLAMAAAILAALAMLRAALKARTDAARQRERGFASLACVAAIALYVVAYVKLPHEAGYLIPLVPCAIWLLAMWLPLGANLVLALLLCASPFIDYRSATPWESAAVPSNQRERLDLEQLVVRAIEAAGHIQGPAIIVAGYRLPAIEAKLGGATQASTRWVYKVKDKAQLAAWQSEGHQVFFVDRATESYQARINGLRLRKLGAKQLELD